ncbi:MAG: thioesterase domain-containing protein [Acidobacteriia bacterium]|nr:thioesterase domain-containing protein [Terriglobia bacterium]
MKGPLKELIERLKTEIPISSVIGLTIERYENGCLTLSVPLGKNINQQGTAFAGSLNATLTLAGWSLVWLILKEANIEAGIVIQDSGIHYRQPVTRDFKACCCKPDAATLEKMLSTLQKKGKARIALSAEIRQAGEVAVAFNGRYVVQVVPRTPDARLEVGS